MVFPPLADDFFVSPGFIHFSPSATLPAINRGIFWNTVRQQNASFSLAFDCFQSEMNRFKPKYFAKREWLSLSHPDSFFMLLQGPAVFLVNSACYFWALMHKCSPHTHTQSIPGCLLWTFGAYPDLMEWFCSVCWTLRLPEARNGRRNVVHVGLVFRESIEREGLGSLLELWKSSWEMWEGRIWNNRS